MVISDDIRLRARQALAAWTLPDQEPELIKYRENAVFRVQLAGKPAALRLHRPGYHSEAALRSELLWMESLRRDGLAVPRPIPSADGTLLVATGDGRQFADLIGWVEGLQVGESGKPLEHGPDELERIFSRLGAAMARMHNSADLWRIPEGFERMVWDGAGLLGERPLWGRFWDCPDLVSADRSFLADLRRRLVRRLAGLPAGLDFGLIHADLVRENVLVRDEQVALIDFDDCGFGWRLFDLATALLRNRAEPHYELIRSSLVEGYRSERPLDNTALAFLPLFVLLRSLTYIGWVGERSELPDAADRIARYVGEVRELAAEFAETL